MTNRAIADEQVVVVEFSGSGAAKAQRAIERLLEQTASFTVTATTRRDHMAGAAKEYGADAVVSGRVQGRKLYLELWTVEGKASVLELALTRAGIPSRAAEATVSRGVIRQIKQLSRLRRQRASLAITGGVLASSEGTPLTDRPMSATTVTPAGDRPAARGAKPGEPPGPGAAQPPGARRVARAIRRAGSIDVDGRLDDEAWGNAPVQEGMYYIVPDWGKKTEEQTRFRVVYDDDALYVGVEAKSHDTSKIVGPLLRYDENERIADSDWVLVGLDSTRSDRNSYLFRINPAGARGELMIVNDRDHAWEWSCRWQGDAARTADGWTAEFKIPYSQVRYHRSESQVWGFNVQRMYGFNILQSWALMTQPHWVSKYGDLEGLVGVQPKRAYSISPYVLGGLDLRDTASTDPLNDDLSPSWTIGADFSAGLFGDFTINGAINPDFGQIGADPDEVNLTDRETFFAERRPLFEESVDLFGFSLGDDNSGNERLFHTRRVGAPPRSSGAALVGSGMAEYFSDPADTTVLGASQLRGTLGGLTVAQFSAVSANEETTYIDAADGSERTARIEPLTSFNVLQIGRESNQGRTGWRLLATSVFRDGDAQSLLVPAHDAAVAAGVALRQRVRKDWEVNVRGTGSYVGGSAAAIARTQTSSLRYFQRPDADHVEFDPDRHSLAGGEFNAQLALKPNWGWGGAIGVEARSPGFEVNDAGFQLDADIATGLGRISWVSAPKTHGLLREYSTTLDVAHVTDWAPENLRTDSRLDNNLTFAQSQFGVNAYVGGSAIHLDRNALRGGPGMAGDLEWRAGAGFRTNARKRWAVSGNVDTWLAPEANTSWSTTVRTMARWQVSSGLNLSIGPSYSVRIDDRQCLSGGCFSPDSMGGLHFLVGRVEQRTIATIFQASYLINTRLSFDAYLQPFLSTGQFSDYKEVVDPRASDYDDRYRVLPDSELIDGGPTYGEDIDGDGVPEFEFPKGNFRQINLRSNFVLRWEYRPDSFLTAVWSQSRGERTAETSSALFEDYTSSFTAPGEHAIFVKLSAWFGR